MSTVVMERMPETFADRNRRLRIRWAQYSGQMARRHDATQRYVGLGRTLSTIDWVADDEAKGDVFEALGAPRQNTSINPVGQS